MKNLYNGVKTLTVRHLTEYLYNTPIQPGEHRLMLRPRDSHDLRILDTALSITPAADTHYYHDPLNNSIALARFSNISTEKISIHSAFRLEHYGTEPLRYDLAPYAQTYPFVYNSNEFPDLMRSIERRYPDPNGEIYQWARQFIPTYGSTDTYQLLRDLNQGVKDNFRYSERHEEGTQAPLETLQQGSGTCRDFALFLMEAARSLGLAARFATGYLYDPALDGEDESTITGSGSTHAWAQIYLPGAGWVECDPTNAIIGGDHLIRVAVVRDPSQAVPVTGSYEGPSEAFRDLHVEVQVTKNEPPETPLLPSVG
ncbi:MAG: transglutaminase family protein [Opitutales bacterium]|nr:transglutaminase family protein [Opitutales bacterium]